MKIIFSSFVGLNLVARFFWWIDHLGRIPEGLSGLKTGNEVLLFGACSVGLHTPSNS